MIVIKIKKLYKHHDYITKNNFIIQAFKLKYVNS